eukprot:TRINITY_DN27822_c0_g1_i1.p1 TRINITY_DN27822_c0_g1~~TRINITY_DN27822_c0_g1_i1.p1  ORF type:complete len:338 (+),score=86.03 TRINITY_DN27822_c0_g1_i1:90-1103(+)
MCIRDRWKETRWAPNGQFEKLTWYEDVTDDQPGHPVVVAMVRSRKKRSIEDRLACVADALHTEIASIVDLEDNALCEESTLAQVVDLLSGSERVCELTISENDISDGGAVGKLCADLPSLRRCDVGWNMFKDAGITAFCATVGTHAVMTHLSFRDNELSSAGAGKLATIISNRQLPCLQSLNLRQNTISSAGAVAICTSLEGHPCIKSIDLRENAIMSSGAEGIASLIKTSKSLTSLALCRNNFADNGTSSIAKAIGAAGKKQLPLKQIWLMDCKIGNNGGKALSQNIGKNKNLLWCDIRMNPGISQVSARFVSDTCSAHRRRADRGGVDSEDSDEW